MPQVCRKTDVCSGHGCFSGDTKIALLSGKDELIKNLVGRKSIDIYAYDTQLNLIVPTQAFDCCLIKRNQQLVEITLDNNKAFKCTLDHKILMRNGVYKEAKDLQANDSVMPLYRKVNSRGYEVIYQNNKWVQTHWLVSEFLGVKLGNRTQRHHKDFNKLNNSFNNFDYINNSNHKSIHNKEDNPMKRQSTKINMVLARHKNGSYKNAGKHFHTDEAIEKRKQRMTENNPMFNIATKVKSAESRAIYFSKEENRKKVADKTIEYFKDKDNRKRAALGTINHSLKKKGFDTYVNFNDLINDLLILQKQGNTFNEISRTIGLSVNGVRRYLNQYSNHKVKTIALIQDKEDVYCMSVPKYHNFALSCGVFVHNCWPPRVSCDWSPNVFVNGLNVERNGDCLIVHCCGPPCHGGTWIGTRSVFANGKSIQVQFDPISCGSSGGQHSPDVFIE